MHCNFCRTFILSILLLLELAGSNLPQTLLNPSKILWHHLFLLNVSVFFVNGEKCSVRVESFSYNHNILLDIQFSDFPSFNDIQIEFL